MLSKRLIDYILLKRYQKENYITTSITPEQLYNITSDDLNKINNVLHSKSNIMYNQILHYDDKDFMVKHHNPSVDRIINQIDLFKEKPVYEIGNIYNDIQKQGYLGNNFFNGNYIEDKDYKYDIPRNIKNKSYGYPSTFENKFYYIDNNINSSRHVNMMRPESTRLNNTIYRFNDTFYN